MWGLWPSGRISSPAGIRAGESPGRGRGVFANRAFRKGELIERAPVILLQPDDRDYLRSTRLYAYYFVVGVPEYPVAVGLGYASLYNHAPRANASYRISIPRSCIEIRAWQRILADEEITINYNGRPDDTSPVWLAPQQP